MSRERTVVQALAALFMVAGATWLVAMIWRTSELHVGARHASHLIGAALTGLTFARAFATRRRSIAIVSAATLAWIVVELVAFDAHDRTPPWAAPFDGSPLVHHALLALLSVPVAALCASVRFQGGPHHRLLWVWFSALVMLGTIVVPLMLFVSDHVLSALGALAIVVAPAVAGALTQILAPSRMIWTCGGGGLVFVLFVLDRTFRGQDPDGDSIAPMFTVGLFLLIGALGARIGWRLARHGDPTTPSTANAVAIATLGRPRRDDP